MIFSKPSIAPKLKDISCKSVDLPDILQCDHSNGTSLPVLLGIKFKVLFFSVFYRDFKKICAFGILSNSDFGQGLELKELAFQALCPSLVEEEHSKITIVGYQSGFIDIDASKGRIVVFTTHVFTVLG